MTRMAAFPSSPTDVRRPQALFPLRLSLFRPLAERPLEPSQPYDVPEEVSEEETAHEHRSVLWPSPTTKIKTRAKVETTAGWRALQRASEDAGERAEVQMFTYSFLCHLCEIGVGKYHVETELYFFPLHHQTVCEGDTLRFYQIGYRLVCGGCARRQGLSPQQCLVPAHTWDRHAIVTGQMIASALFDLYYAHVQQCLHEGCTHTACIKEGSRLASTAPVCPTFPSSLSPREEQQHQQREEEHRAAAAGAGLSHQWNGPIPIALFHRHAPATAIGFSSAG